MLIIEVISGSTYVKQSILFIEWEQQILICQQKNYKSLTFPFILALAAPYLLQKDFLDVEIDS